MRTEWGRDERTDWPSSKPVYTILLLVVSVLAGAGVECFRYLCDWTPLERYYLPIVCRDARLPGPFARTDGTRCLELATRKGSRLALDSEVQPVVTDSGEKTFALTDDAIKQGALRLEWQRHSYDNIKLHAFLGDLDLSGPDTHRFG